MAKTLQIASRVAHRPRKALELLSVLPTQDAEYPVQVREPEPVAMGDLSGWKVRVPQAQEEVVEEQQEPTEEVVVESTSLGAVRFEPMKVSKLREF